MIDLNIIKLFFYMAKKKNSNTGFIVVLIFLLVIIAVLVWGLIGANQAEKIGVTCDFGLGDNTLCWTWHQNVVGDIQEGINDFKKNFEENE